MAKVREVQACSACGRHVAQWAGRCPGCDAWGTIETVAAAGPVASSRSSVVSPLGGSTAAETRVPTGFEGIDRVLGGGLVPASVILLAGEPGIGKSTLLLQVIGRLSGAGLPCLLASGEESRGQVAARAERLGVPGDSLTFMSGRELPDVLEAARSAAPFLLAVDSIQTLRDPDSTSMPGGPSQVRGCADALVGLAKELGITVLMTGHVTKEGDVAGPRTLEHAVDVVLSFEGEPRSGQRLLAGGKNRFGPEGEVAWFEMQANGLMEVDPGDRLVSGGEEPGAALALPLAGRRALAVEVQALVVPTEGSARRQVAGLDPRRFQLIAAVVDRMAGIPLSRTDLYGAASGGVRIDDPGCDLAIAAALASAATGRKPPPGSAFVGEIGLTGQIRPVPGMEQRLKAALTRGSGTVYGPSTPHAKGVLAVTHVRDALQWATGSDSAP